MSTTTNESFVLNALETVVLNALLDLHSEDPIALKGRSQRELTNILDSVLSSDERTHLQSELDRLTDLQKGETEELTQQLYDFVAIVSNELADEGYIVSVDHTYRQQLSQIDVELYLFLQTGDKTHLERLDIKPETTEAVLESRDLLESGAEEKACAVISESTTGRASEVDDLVMLVVAGWYHFLARDDETAVEFVTDALELDDTLWIPKLVGTAASKDHNDRIRTGETTIGVVLRWVTDSSESTSVEVKVGNTFDTGKTTWSNVESAIGHALLTQIYPEMTIRFTLRGEPPEFPGLQAYYLGVGAFNNDIGRVEKVFTVFGSGPEGAGSIENITISKPQPRET